GISRGGPLPRHNSLSIEQTEGPLRCELISRQDATPEADSPQTRRDSTAGRPARTTTVTIPAPAESNGEAVTCTGSPRLSATGPRPIVNADTKHKIASVARQTPHCALRRPVQCIRPL